MRTRKDPWKAKRISDASHVAYFTKDGKRIALFGDIHVSNTDGCKSCTPPDCLGYLDIIRAYKNYHASNGELDIYFEGFVSENMKHPWYKWLLMQAERLDRFTLKLRRKPLKIYNVRKELYPNAFFHKSQTTRVHTIDVRLLPIIKQYGFDLRLLLSGDEMYYNTLEKKYPTKKSLQNALNLLAFREDTKIAKQFYKLPKHQQICMRKFVEERMKKMPSNPFLYTVILLMDIYGLCRFLRFFEKQPIGSTSLFFTGSMHSWNYQAFLLKWGASKVFSTLPTTPDNLFNAKACTRISFSTPIVERDV